MKEALLLKCGELVLKGLNRKRFEDKLLTNLRRRLKKAGECKVSLLQSTIYVEPEDGVSMDDVYAAAKNVFGIASICRSAVCEKNIEAILETTKVYLRDALESAKTFKVESKRADKQFPMSSIEISQEIGGCLDDDFENLTPDMHHPELLINVEIREHGAYIHAGKIEGAGGLPVGINGKASLLLSGGIDSPVAGYMMAKRGLELACVHFFSYPYTSERAKEKVFALAEKLTHYAGRMEVYVVPFTKIQEQIRANCQEDMFTIIMRRFMMRIAEEVSLRNKSGALITGESLGQVASQTMEAMTVTGEPCKLPIFRPVIGMDKEEIVTIARKIDTFETSILPYEDCCTVFTPKHPQTKPKLYKIVQAESVLDIETLVKDAVENVEKIVL